MSNPNCGFTWLSWADTQDEALRSQRRAEAEEECLGVQYLNEFMAKAEELDEAIKQLLQEI